LDRRKQQNGLQGPFPSDGGLWSWRLAAVNDLGPFHAADFDTDLS